MNPAPTLTLTNGVKMPQLGLGTWPMDDADAAVAVAGALRIGYRLIDTAENYENERGVGEGIHNSGVDRAEVFVTTKFNRTWHSIEGARQHWLAVRAVDRIEARGDVRREEPTRLPEGVIVVACARPG